MKKIVLFSLTLLVLLVVKPTLQVSAGRALPVHISQGGDVDYEVANLSRSANDEVVWYSDGDDFTVSFQTSKHRSGEAGGCAWSLPVFRYR